MRGWLLIPWAMACVAEPDAASPVGAPQSPAADTAAPTDTAPPVAEVPPGPGVGNVAYDPGELFHPIGWIDTSTGVPGPTPDYPITLGRPFGTNTAAMHGGWFITLFAPDSGFGPGGLLFYDVSDPRAPRLVNRVYEPEGRTSEFREAHALGFSHVGDRELIAVHSGRGLELWDVRDVMAPVQVSKLALPGVSFGDYEGVAWQLFWQGTHVYVASAGQGLFVVDVANPDAPVLADRGGLPNPIPPAELGGFRIGPVFALGNLLVVSSMDNATGYAALDLSDPVHPSLLSARTGLDRFYSVCMGGGLVATSTRGSGARMLLDDLSDPIAPQWRSTDLVVDEMLYCAFQDDAVFQGAEDEVVKIDLTDPTAPRIVGRGELGRLNTDHGQVTPIGNLVFVGNDHGTGSAFVPHQTEPDTTPPRVALVQPADGSVAQSLLTRVGIAFTDAIDLHSVSPATFTVRPVGGAPLTGRTTAHGSLVNFEPDAPLLPDTTYEVIVAAGGVRDWVGNAIDVAHTSTFRTARDTSTQAIAGLLAHWPCDEGEGRVALERSGRDRPAELRGDAQLGTAGLAFGGTDGTARVVVPQLDTTAGRTVSAWLTVADADRDAWWVDGMDTTGTGWALATLRGVPALLTGPDTAGVLGPAPLGSGAHHVAVTQDAAGALGLFVDGVQVATGAGPAPARTLIRENLYLGSRDGTDAFASGVVRDVRVYSRPLSGAEIRALVDGTDRGVKAWIHVQPPAPAVTGQPVTLRATTGGPGTPQVTWRFGDDSGWTQAADPSEITHTFATPGHYTVVASVTDGAQRAAHTRTITVTRPLGARPPRRSSTLALDADRQRLWVVNRDHDSVSIVHPTDLSVLREIPVGRGPRNVASDAGGRAGVTLDGHGSVVVLAPDGSMVDEVDLGVGSRPVGVVITHDGDRAIVAASGVGQLVALDTMSRAHSATLTVGPHPHGLAIAPDGRVLATRFLSPDDRGEVYVADAGLTTVRTVALARDTTTVDAEDRARGLPNLLATVAVNPDGVDAWVATTLANTLRGGLRDGTPLTHESTIRSVVRRLDLDAGTERAGAGLDLNDRAPPVDIQLSPLGDYAFVALEGNHLVQIHDAFTGQAVGALPKAGSAVQGLALGGSPPRLYAHAWLSREVVAYDVGDVLASRSFQAPIVGRVRTVGAETLSADVLRGKLLFHEASDPRISLDGYLSCAVCHPDGGHDGRVWDFTDRGEGLRNTTDLRGRRGTGHGPVHWTANFDEIQDFEHDLRNAFGGSGLIADADFHVGTRDTPLGDPKAGLSADLDALAAYVTSLDAFPASPWRDADGGLTAEAEAGADLFDTLACATCHGGDDLTVSATGARFDVGTITAASGTRLGGPLDALDVPTLRGVWATAPYLHDGSAPTLRDVLLTRNPDDAHGVTSPLSDDAIDALVAFLLSLD